MKLKLYENLPDYMQEGARQYIENGRPAGDFLMYVFKNDLCHSFAHADDTNIMHMYEYAKMLYHAPLGCWGSEEKVIDWVKQGGVYQTRLPIYFCPDCNHRFDAKSASGGCPKCDSEIIQSKIDVKCRDCDQKKQAFSVVLKLMGWNFLNKGDRCPDCQDKLDADYKPEPRLGDGERGETYGI